MKNSHYKFADEIVCFGITLIMNCSIFGFLVLIASVTFPFKNECINFFVENCFKDVNLNE